MALDARDRSEIYQKLTRTLGEHHANVLMSQFPSVEADELVTKQFLRAELAELRSELRNELRNEIGSLRSELRSELHRHTLWFGGALASSTSLLAAIGLFS